MDAATSKPMWFGITGAVGGSVTSTILNLLVLPTLALRYGRFGETNPSEALT